MSPAIGPRARPLSEKLLTIDRATGAVTDRGIADLTRLLHPGDLLIVNDAATLPGSLRAASGEEIRLARAVDGERFWCILLDGKDWRTPTEDRKPAEPRERWDFGPGLSAAVEEYESPRFALLRFEAGPEGFLAALYRHARPIQYSYLRRELALWDFQNGFASRPWALEMPSAGRPLSWQLLLGLRDRGVGLASLTHAAGISSSGDAALDARLPLAERYEIPERTIREIESAPGRIVAAGTSVVRALEASALENGGQARAGLGETSLRISGDHRLRVVDTLLSGMHEPGASHFELLEAFAPRPVLERALDHARKCAYLTHEFGDSCLIGAVG